jgi:hypothetical protein
MRPVRQLTAYTPVLHGHPYFWETHTLHPELAASTGRREIALVGGLIDETRLTLSVHGDDLDPDEVTRLLSCSPSGSHRRGELAPRSARPWPKGAWLLTVEGKAPVQPEHLLASLLDRLPSDPGVWQALRGRYSVALGFGLFQDAWNRGFDLSPGIVQRVAALGLGLGFDIYAPDDDNGG